MHTYTAMLADVWTRPGTIQLCVENKNILVQKVSVCNTVIKNAQQKKEEKRTLKTTSAKLEITFSASFLGTVCRARHWPCCNFLWESQFDIIMFSGWKRPSKQQINYPKAQRTGFHLQFTCTCHILHFSPPFMRLALLLHSQYSDRNCWGFFFGG